MKTHDENGNNVEKLELEKKLAWYIEVAPGELVKDVFHKATLNVWNVFAEHLWASLEEHCQEFQKVIFDMFYYELGPDSFQLYHFPPPQGDNNEHEKRRLFVEQLQKILTDREAPLFYKAKANTMVCFLLFHRLDDDFRSQVLPADYKEHEKTYREVLKSPANYPSSRRYDRDTAEVQEFLQMEKQILGCNVTNFAEMLAKNRATVAKLLTTQFGIFAANSKYEKKPKKTNPHTRGIDLHQIFPVKETSTQEQYQFNYHARDDLDMPLASGPSSSVAQSIFLAKILYDLTPEEYRLYFLVQMAYNIGGGHHTFHECASAIKFADFPYVEGDYTSVFPKDFIENAPIDPKHPERSWLQTLKMKFPNLFNINFEQSEETIIDSFMFAK